MKVTLEIRVKSWLFGKNNIGLPLALSVVLHTLISVTISHLNPVHKPPKSQPIQMKLKDKPKTITQPEPKKEEKPNPPKQKTEPKPKRPKAASKHKPKKKPKKPPKAVQGLSNQAVASQGKGIAAPIGNTLLKEDDGKWVNPKDLENLSADAQLIAQSVIIPQYTEEAIDANLEGLVVVAVFVDEKGQVVEAELTQKVGYNMDNRILASAKNARFHPRKDRFGRAIAGWTEIKFQLVIP